ncbi:MAG: hypothetical protein ACXVW6_01705 [Nocardioidaceae bacterium]
MTVETVQPTHEGTGPGTERPAPVDLGRVLGLTVLVLTLLLVTQVGAQAVNNGDAWFHLRLGHEFWGSWSLWHPGAPTRFATSDWVPTQWSTEMLSAKAEDWFGLPGVAWMYGAVYVSFVVAVYAAGRRLAGPLPAAAAATLAVFAASTTLSARPQVVSLVLLAVTVRAWWGTIEDGRPRWWLVPMTWVWATAHGLWTSGVLLGLVCVVGLVLDGRARGRGALRLLAVPVGSLVAALLTPVGPAILTSQVAVSRRTPMIAEWGATSFRTLPALVLAAMVAVVVLLGLRRGRVPWPAVLMLGLAVGWGLLVTRMVAPAAVVVAPLLAQAMARRVAGRDRPRVPRGEKVAVAVVVLACLAGLAVAVPTTADHAADVPTGFTPRLAALPRGSAVLVEDSTGAWLEWRFPGLQPVIDGLLDAYPVDYIQRFDDFRDVRPGWRGFVAGSGAQYGVMLRGSAASTALVERLHWRVLGTDHDWVLLAAPGAEALS